MNDKYQWLEWVNELQQLAQNGLAYAHDKFDKERYERLREISVEMMSSKTGLGEGLVKDLFASDLGYQTPKLDNRAVIFKNDKILLVQESDKRWSLPGGWQDANQSIRSNIIKEVGEETGYKATPLKILALQDRNKHNPPLYAINIYKVFVLCEVDDSPFQPNIETLARAYFDLEELPELAEEKTTKAQLEMCFKAYKNEEWEVYFD